MLMLRSLTKTCFAYTYTYAGAARQLLGKSPAPQPAMPFIVGYHRVVENFERSARQTIPSMLISASMLERHIDWLLGRFTILSLDDIGSHLQSPRFYSKPPAAITFDDGYSDVYHHALPLLVRKGVPAAVFVVSGLVGTGKPQIFDRLYSSLRNLDSRGISLADTVAKLAEKMHIETPSLHSAKPATDEPFRIMTLLLNSVECDRVERITATLERSLTYSKEFLNEVAPLTWDMITEMDRKGVTIGSHTKSHVLLTSESLRTVRKELVESKRTLEAKLGKPVHHFAYPDGRFSPVRVEAVAAAGYRYAYGICRARDQRFPLLTIPRKVLWENASINAFGRFSPAVMACHANGAFSRSDACPHNHHSTQEVSDHANIC